MNIREAQKEDSSRISQIICETFYSTFCNDGNKEEVTAYLDSLNDGAIAAMMEDEKCTFLVHEENGTIEGCIQLLKEAPYSYSTGAFLMVDRLYVSLNQLGKGIGGELLKEAIKHAKSRSYDTIWLLVLRSNLGAVRFYERFGFESFDTSPGKFEGDKELDLWLKLDLS